MARPFQTPDWSPRLFLCGYTLRTTMRTGSASHGSTGVDHLAYSSGSVRPLMSWAITHLDVDRFSSCYVICRCRSCFVLFGNDELTYVSLSEDYSHWHHLPGSYLFCNPSEVEHWQQKVSYPESSIPTPPESECPSLEPQDMVTQWSQTTMSEEWPVGSTSEQGQYYQPTSGSWQGPGAPVTAQGIAALNTATLLTAPPRSVDLGSSPVLSYESQSLDTLNSSEPDTSCVLPPTLDLSFATEPVWTYPSPSIYSASDVPSHLSGFGFSGVPDQSLYPVGCSVAAAPVVYSGTHGQMIYPSPGQYLYQRRTISYPAVVPMRPLLPRTEGSTVSSQSAVGRQQVERTHMQRSHGPQYTVPNVSNLSGQRKGVPEATSNHPTRHITGPSQYASHTLSGPAHTATSLPNVISYGQMVYGAPASLVSDPTDEDFSAYIHYDHEEHSGTLGALRSGTPFCCVCSYVANGSDSFTSGYEAQSGLPSAVQEEVKPLVSAAFQDMKHVSQRSSTANSLASENDEGRHRTHPLYSEGPKADGKYHCPYKNKDPNCQHEPTKLKCNYEYDHYPSYHISVCFTDRSCHSSKFIDSHLKPFRCKVEACAKQEFSSTACLLRHEREAHGMHGHGDRPHLCEYTGCDRSLPGNGFPRRYNLFDHMKRVHDHKESPAESTGSPMTGADSQKKGGNRKRKASASPPAPAAQRPKATSSMQQNVQAMYYPTPGYLPGSIYDVEPNHRNHAMPLWSTQRSLMAKQMDMLQQDAELRRMTAEARRR